MSVVCYQILNRRNTYVNFVVGAVEINGDARCKQLCTSCQHECVKLQLVMCIRCTNNKGTIYSF